MPGLKGGLYIWGAIAVFLVTQVVYILTLTIQCPFWDSGEFIATSAILGIPHPPGTPLYVLIGRIFSMLPLFEQVATRVNFLSAFASSLAAAFTYMVGFDLYRRWFTGDDEFEPRIAFFAGTIAALFTAFGRTFWDNAIEAEVYALSNLIMIVCFWLILRWGRPGSRVRRTGLFLFLYYLICLSMGIHLGTFLVLPGIVLFALIVDRRIFGDSWPGAMAVAGILVLLHPGMLPTLGFGVWVPLLAIVLVLSLLAPFVSIHSGFGPKGIVTWCALIALVGISTHFYLLIRAGLGPAINEADPSNWDALWKVLIRDQYKPPNPFLYRKAAMDIQLTRHFGDYAIDQYRTGLSPQLLGMMVPYILGLIGLIGQGLRERKGFALMFVTYVIMSFGLVFYLNFREDEVRDRDYFFVASFHFFSLWIGLGSAYLIEELRSFVASKSLALQRGVVVSGGVLLLLLPLGTLRTHWFSHDRSEFYVAVDFAYNVLNSVKPNAIIFTNGDNDTFPLWYAQEVEHHRQDVRVVNLSLLNTDWYLRQLRDQEPTVDHGWEDKILPYVVQFSGFSAAHAGGQVSSERFREFVSAIGLRPYVRDMNTALLTKDVAVARIIEREGATRPIYVALTVPDRMGFETRLVQKGVVLELASDEGGRNRLDIAETERLMNEVYRFRGVLNEAGEHDRSTFLDDTSTRLVQNYAATYLAAAQDLLSAGENARALELGLKARAISPQAPAVSYSLGVLYRQLGQFSEMEAAFQSMVDRGQADSRAVLYLALSQELQENYAGARATYEAALGSFGDEWDIHRGLFAVLWKDLEQRGEAVQVLENWLAAHPDDSAVRQALAVYRDSLDLLGSG